MKPGFEAIRICPYLPESMNEFTCRYDSANGMICVHVKDEGEKIELTVQLPQQMECEIDLTELEKRGKAIRKFVKRK